MYSIFIQKENAASKCIRVMRTNSERDRHLAGRSKFYLLNCGSVSKWLPWVWRVDCVKYVTIHTNWTTAVGRPFSCHNKILERSFIGKKCVRNQFIFIFSFLLLLLLVLLLLLLLKSIPSFFSGKFASIEMNQSPNITSIVPNHHRRVVCSPKINSPIAAYAHSQIRWENFKC